ncbi:MAG: hypothetical protein K2N05_01565 [Muribaculaceae bacterium]|nr:hypothetical protein [Muribaculaceae bacterium]
MNNSSRIIINTGAQYARSLINLVLSLYSTRLILHALGIDDYGIFTLIAGVVAMLAFMTNAMVTTTQRFMSYHQTKSTVEEQKKIFGCSVLMHIIFGIIIIILLEIVGTFLFDGFLNISSDRISAAKIVYQCAIVMIILSFISAPFKALLISYENIVYVSIIDVLDGVLKVVIAFILLNINQDKLILYGYLMVLIYLSDLFAFMIYDFRNYKTCVIPKLAYLNKGYIKSMGSFVVWQLYSTGCVIGRTQGVALVLNRFYGTVVNASFGIALQVSGAINFISSALVTAINPQIIKAEGSGNRAKMFRLAEVASKFSFLLLDMVVMPLLFCLPTILKFWLGEVPEDAVLFCRVILITGLVDQITYGLITTNQAIGNIRPYTLTVNTIKVLTVFALWALLILGVPIESAIWVYAVFELICALTRLPFMKYTGGLNIGQFIRNVFLKLTIPSFFLIAAYYGLHLYTHSFLIYVIGIIMITPIYFYFIFKFSLNNLEREIVKGMVVNLRNKIKR